MGEENPRWEWSGQADECSPRESSWGFRRRSPEPNSDSEGPWSGTNHGGGYGAPRDYYWATVRAVEPAGTTVGRRLVGLVAGATALGCRGVYHAACGATSLGRACWRSTPARAARKAGRRLLKRGGDRLAAALDGHEKDAR